jgi:hypothetical protein
MTEVRHRITAVMLMLSEISVMRILVSPAQTDVLLALTGVILAPIAVR